MHHIKKISLVTIMLFLTACTSLTCKYKYGSVLQGTDTAVVGIYLDNNGYPQVNIETVTVYPGQKIIFVGPDKFDILFKDQKSPIDKLEVQSANGIVTIEIPRDIFERQKTPNSIDLKKLSYKYGIRVNGKVTDPGIDITRR